MKQIKILVTGGLFLTAFSAHATWYTNLSDFKKALNPKYSDVNLSNLTLTGVRNTRIRRRLKTATTGRRRREITTDSPPFQMHFRHLVRTN